MQNEVKQSPADEIDLGELLLKLSKIVNRNKWTMILLTIAGMILGILHFSLKSPVFESSMMLRSNILTQAYSETLANNLKRLIEERNDTLLSRRLKVSIEEASHLKDIKVESVVETEAAEGSAGNVIFIISVEVTDNAILNNLQTGIMSFLENNEFVKKRIDLKRDRLETLISKVKLEIQEIDSLKKRVNQAITYNEQGGVVVLDPTNVYSKALALYKEELSYQQGLELIDSTQLIEGFTAFNRPIKPRMLHSAGGGLLAGLFLAFGLIFIRETRSYLRSIE